VAYSAIGSGVGAGVANYLPSAGGAASAVTPTTAAATATTAMAGAASSIPQHMLDAGLRSAVGNTITQGIATVTGLQEEFNWRSVAAAAVGGSIGAGTSQSLQETAFANSFGQFGVRAVSGFAGGMATAAVGGGRIDVQMIAQQSFGDALGENIKDRMIDSDNGQWTDVLNTSQDEGLSDSYWATHPMMYASNDVADPLFPQDQLKLNSLDGTENIDPRFVPSATSVFVNEYMTKNPNASINEIQAQYDSTSYAQSDAHLMRQTDVTTLDMLETEGAQGEFERFNRQAGTISSYSESGIVHENGRNYYLMMRGEDRLGIYKAADVTTVAAINRNVPSASKMRPAPTGDVINPLRPLPQSSFVVGTSSGRYDFGPNEPYRPYLERAAQRNGFDPAQLAAIVNAEAGRTRTGMWNPAARAPRGTAYGLTQYLRDSWIEVAQREGTTLNDLVRHNGWLERNGRVSRNAENDLLTLRADPNLAITTAAEDLRYNLNYLQNRGLIPPNATPDERIRYGYIAHHEGRGGAANFLDGTLSNDRAHYLLSQQIGREPAAAWARSYPSDREAYQDWLWRYTRAHITPQRFRR